MGRLSGKVAIVTGAGSGFGEAMAHAFVAEGAHVLVADIAVDSANRVVEAIMSKKEESGTEGSAIFAPLDVTQRHQWEEALAVAVSRFGKLDVVVNNAGTTYRKQPSIDVAEEDFDRIINVNIKSIYLSVAVVMPYFKEQKNGVFLSTSSVAASKVRPGQVWYGGTKAFLGRVSQGLAAEYGPYGVRVNCLCPLRGATGLLEMFSGVSDTPEERERFAKTVPLGRMSEPQDVANAAVYLASDEASFISGVDLPIDGGRLTV
ncbi:hypothetical protein FE257_003808 [Aspergillus nanangensis]|uniref:Uncharacterized protein n=1 Tax=Aspergillus nanangensis TaxID=2582783 RepID=A0AAD4CBI8_ASPNN|nr:hypothetical protein FE257_003808 [Aspergillus nanangensis]